MAFKQKLLERAHDSGVGLARLVGAQAFLQHLGIDAHMQDQIVGPGPESAQILE